MRIYLSGGMKGDWQDKVKILLGDSNTYLDPRNHYMTNAVDYARCDSMMVSQSDLVFAYMSQDNPSGIGLAYEVGLAKGLGKTVVLVSDLSLHKKNQFEIIKYSADMWFLTIDQACEAIRRILL